ncbi:MAG: ABC transporter permease [Candidatus Gastranaerophilales bacterium]|nr:ABC transporter permease [Candidatus Gastranaerophilales bacterium]
MNAFVKTSKREVKKLAANPFILVILFIAPLFVCFVIAFTFLAGSATDLPVAVLDMDNSNLSRKIVRMIDATPACEVKYRVADLKEGKELISGGNAYALVYIPKDFKRDITRGTRPQLVYYYNNQAILIGGVITKEVQTAIQSVMAGITLKIQMKKGLPKDAAMAKINLIRVDEHIHSNPYLNYSYFLSYAAFAHTFQIIIIFLVIWSLGVEFKEGTTKEWLETANNSIFAAVFGKLAVYMVCFLVLMTIAYGTYVLAYSAPFEANLIFLTLGTFCFILAYQMAGVIFVAVLSNLRFALSSGAFYTSLGLTFAGMTYPAMAMPPFAQFYSALLPIRPYVNLVIDQMMRGFAPKYDVIYVVWMLALAAFGFFFLPLLKKHAQDESLWYQL